MNNGKGMVSCAIGCWLVAGLAGLLAAVLLMLLGGWTFVQAVFAAAVIFAIAGALLSWILCRPLPAAGEMQPGQSDEAARKAQENRAAAEARSATAAQNADASANAATSTADTQAPAPAAKAAAPATTAVKASAALPGQEELSARKGEWKYEGDTAPEPAPKPAAKKAPAKKAPAKAKAKPAPVTKKEAAPKQAPVAADGKPETLSAAREGGPDDLKMIKGVGPKLEALLHSMGFYHFDQVASWRKKEVAWVDENLEGFKGRVTRDEWVKQAKILAKGGTTEFSKKVDKGGVY